MARLEVLNPVAEIERRSVAPAPRPSSLKGKTVGLVWNMKAGGDIALDRIASLMAERIEGVRTVRFDGAFGGHRIALVSQIDPGDADRIAKQCDVVVGTTAD